MKKIKKIDVARLNTMLQGAKMTKGDLSAKMALVNALVSTKEEAEKYLDFEKTTIETLKKENHAEIEALEKKESLTVDEVKKINDYYTDYNAQVNKALNEEQEKRVSVDLKPWNQEQLEALFVSNDFTGAQMVSLRRVLLEEKPETDKKA